MKRKLYLSRETLTVLTGAVAGSPTIRTCTACSDEGNWVAQPSCCDNCQSKCGC